jgi:DNA-binding SARP family transcriptional activator/pimeloyl-ACP methyl ester carboxylesterase
MTEGSGGSLKARSTGLGQGATPRASTIRLLGPVDVEIAGHPVPLRSRHARTMLAALAVRAGQVLAAGALVEAMWGDAAPRTALHALHVHASTLRKLLPDDLPIIGRRGGYVLQVGPGRLDTDRFEDFVARGRAELSSGEPDAAAGLLRAALGLWRGSALADVTWERFAESDVRRWAELRLAAEEDLVEAELAAGRSAAAVGDLETMVGAQPYRERRWGQLMVALYRCGRQAAALDRYREVHRLLADELGIDPSAQLRELQERILRQDDALDWTGSGRDLPVTHYARAPAGRLAYQVLGDGPSNLVFVPGFGGNVELRWEEPNLSRLYRRLARSARLILLDKRGTGLSDRVTGIPPIEDQVDDVLAVMDAAGVERAAVLGVMDGGAIALLAAAAHPQRVHAAVTYACFSAFELLGDTAVGLLDTARTELDQGVLFEDALPTLAPSRVGDPAFVRWMGRYLRMAAGIDGSAALLDRFQQVDIRAVLADVAVPVLALHREHDKFVPAGNATYIAAHVQNGRAVLLPGTDSIIWAGDVDAIAAHIEHFLTETPTQTGTQPEPTAPRGPRGVNPR